MTDHKEDVRLVERLHILRIEHRMTIAEMAEKCALPKSSLESYLKLEGARKPGVEALIAIATAFEISVDWLLGLSEVRPSQTANSMDRAVACMAVVDALLSRLADEQAKASEPIIKGNMFAGVHKIEVAARTMLSYFQTMEMMETSSGGEGSIRERDLEQLRNVALEKAIK